VPKDYWKAAFKTHMGLFKPNVMLFRLQGAPGTFSRMIAVDVNPMYCKFPPDQFKHYMDDCLHQQKEIHLIPLIPSYSLLIPLILGVRKE